MLMPFQWAVLTIEEAKLLMQYIEKTTSTKTIPKHYEKMQKAGMFSIYEKLREFVEVNAQYECHLRYLDPSDFETRDY